MVTREQVEFIQSMTNEELEVYLQIQEARELLTKTIARNVDSINNRIMQGEFDYILSDPIAIFTKVFTEIKEI
jgi:hypothetical protein